MSAPGLGLQTTVSRSTKGHAAPEVDPGEVTAIPTVLAALTEQTHRPPQGRAEAAEAGTA